MVDRNELYHENVFCFNMKLLVLLNSIFLQKNVEIRFPQFSQCDFFNCYLLKIYVNSIFANSKLKIAKQDAQITQILEFVRNEFTREIYFKQIVKLNFTIFFV